MRGKTIFAVTLSLFFLMPTSCELLTSLLTTADPTFTPNGGTFTAPQQVSISCTTKEAQIRYTTDGSDPSESEGELYQDPLLVSETTTIKAVAYADGLDPSRIVGKTFTITVGPAVVAAPVFSPDGGAVQTVDMVSLSCSTQGAAIRYTTDGVTAPTATSGILYEDPFNLPAGSIHVQAVAYTEAGVSSVSSADFTVTAPEVDVEAPTFTPDGGTFNAVQHVTLDCATEGASIRYTTDGVTVPTATVGTLYTEGSPITVSEPTKIKAVAYIGSDRSTVVTRVFTITTSGIIIIR